MRGPTQRTIGSKIERHELTLSSLGCRKLRVTTAFQPHMHATSGIFSKRGVNLAFRNVCHRKGVAASALAPRSAGTSPASGKERDSCGGGGRRWRRNTSEAQKSRQWEDIQQRGWVSEDAGDRRRTALCEARPHNHKGPSTPGEEGSPAFL